MWIRTLTGAYINVALVEVFDVVRRREVASDDLVDGLPDIDDPHPDDDYFVSACTAVSDGDNPFTDYALYGPFDSEEEGQVKLAQLVQAIHDTLYPGRGVGRPKRTSSRETAEP